MGVSLRHSLKMLRKNNPFKWSKEKLAEETKLLDPVDVPPSAHTLLQTFKQLSTRRSYDRGGPQPITFTEIDAYNRLLDKQMTPWEIETIASLDGVFINTWHDLNESTQRDQV